MVTTRAGGKRANSDPAPQPAKKKLKKLKKGSKAKKVEPKPAAAKKPHIGFLDLPAELRNRIYEFATEDPAVCCHDHPPLLTHRSPHQLPVRPKQWSIPEDVPSTQRFFALTQVCKQIREEYRPLWLRNARLRIEPQRVEGFLYTFYPTPTTHEHAPKCLQLSWNHWRDCVDNEFWNLTPLLKLCAACSTSKVEFVPHGLVEGTGPDPEDSDSDSDGDAADCDVCIDEMLYEGYGYPFTRKDQKHLEALHEDHLQGRREIRYERWMDGQHEEYGYLHTFNAFLNHSNNKWLEDIRSGSIIRIAAEFDVGSPPEVHIQLSHAAATMRNDGNSMFVSAMAYLKDRGLSSDGFGDVPLPFNVTVKVV